jgi:anthranilate phosphoribosyltransferase
MASALMRMRMRGASVEEVAAYVGEVRRGIDRR